MVGRFERRNPQLNKGSTLLYPTASPPSERGAPLGKRLVITYGDVVLFDGQPEQVSWKETGDGISVKAGADKPAGSELLAKLAQAAQQRREADGG